MRGIVDIHFNPIGDDELYREFCKLSPKYDGVILPKCLVTPKKTKFEKELYLKTRGLYQGSVSNLVSER